MKIGFLTNCAEGTSLITAEECSSNSSNLFTDNASHVVRKESSRLLIRHQSTNSIALLHSINSFELLYVCIAAQVVIVVVAAPKSHI